MRRVNAKMSTVSFSVVFLSDFHWNHCVDQKHCIIKVFFTDWVCLGCSLHGHVLSACVSWRLPACARTADLGWSLATESHGGWGAGIDVALTRDCPKPTVLIRITPIISLSHSLSLALCISLHLPPFLPPFPPTHSLSSSFLLLFLLLTPHPSITTYPKTNAPHWLVCCHGDHSCPIFSLLPLFCSQWSLRVDFRKSILDTWAPIYVLLDRLICCQGNCYSYYRHGDPCVQYTYVAGHW